MFQPRLFLYLFDHTVLPILNYASEIWGFDEWPKLETLHLKACKYALGVRTNTTTDAVYAELGRMSLQYHRHVKILKFLSRLSSLEPERYANKAFIMLVDDADSGQSNWISKSRNLQLLYDIQNSDSHSLTKLKVKRHFEIQLLVQLNEHITQDKKLNLYASFKSSSKFEPYLDILSDFKVRSTLAKLRLSAHILLIETGRFSKNKKPRNERFCPYCKSLNISTVENEIHFVLTCPLYKKERKQLLDPVYENFPNIASLNQENIFI